MIRPFRIFALATATAVAARRGELKLSFGGLWAVARLTLLEASRRRVIAILLLFTAAILSSMAFFPSVEPTGRLRLMQSWALRATSLFTAIVALFITGFSLPSDFEQKRIYLLVTKPISKATIFLGKFLGLTILLAFFVAAMGLVTALFIRTIQAFSGPGFPKVLAFERHDADDFGAIADMPRRNPQDERRSILAQEPGSRLIWKFTGLRRKDFESTLSLETRLTIAAVHDLYRASGTIVLEARNPAGFSFRAEDFLNTNEEREWTLPSELVGPEGSFEISLRCTDDDAAMSGTKSSAALYLKPTLFEPAFARGMVLLFFQSMTILSLTLAASALLSAPLSILLGILLYIVGASHSYMRDGTRDIDRSLAEITAGAKNVHTPAEIPPWFLRFSSAVSGAVLALVPDFDQFDYAKWLLKDRAVSGRDLAEALSHALPVVLVLGFLGMILLIFKDYG